MIYILNLTTGKITLRRKKDISCKECFGINKKEGDRSETEYIVIGEKGFIYLNQEFNKKIERNQINLSYQELKLLIK